MYEGKTTVVGKQVESCTFASKKCGALMKHPKNETLSQKMRLALPISIPASCFFYQQAVHAFEKIWCDRSNQQGAHMFDQALCLSESALKVAWDRR